MELLEPVEEFVEDVLVDDAAADCVAWRTGWVEETDVRAPLDDVDGVLTCACEVVADAAGTAAAKPAVTAAPAPRAA